MVQTQAVTAADAWEFITNTAAGNFLCRKQRRFEELFLNQSRFALSQQNGAPGLWWAAVLPAPIAMARGESPKTHYIALFFLFYALQLFGRLIIFYALPQEFWNPALAGGGCPNLLLISYLG